MAKPILIDPKAAFPEAPRLSVGVAPSASSGSNVNSAASRPPNGYYVIIGCGAAAVINHTTLRQSPEGKARLGMTDIGQPTETPGLPVMHVGFRDPWSEYHAHGMGQPPYLLRMPGYHAVPDFNARTIHTGLDSTVFAKSTADERALLQRHFLPNTFFFDGWVAAIEKFDKRFADPAKKELLAKWKDAWKLDAAELTDAFDEDWKKDFPPYRLVVVRPFKLKSDSVAVPLVHIVYAHKIDICSGAGPMNVRPREGKVDLFETADRPPWLAPEFWDAETKSRAVVHGMDGLTEATIWKDTERVGVYGAGGIGLNQVERARDVGCALDWLATQSHDGTVNLYRNFNAFGDFKRLDPTKPAEVMWELTDTAKLDAYKKKGDYLPAHPKWRYAINAKIGKAEDAGSGKLRLAANPANKPPPLMRDHFNPGGFACGADGTFKFNLGYLKHVGKPDSDASLYDRIMLCIGQDTAAPGEPSKITAALGNPEFLEVDGVGVGVKFDGGIVRVLGAAAASFPAAKLNDKALEKANPATELFIKSLPVSAVVPGFIRAGWTIAMANGFIGSKGTLNTNINTATEAELQKGLEDGGIGGGDAGKIAKLIVHVRMAPANGIPGFDELKKSVDERAAPTWKGEQLDQDAAKLALKVWDKIPTSLSMDYPDAEEWK